MGQSKNKFVILFSILLPLAIITAIYDLTISKNVINQNSVWAQFLENYGMIPGIFIILTGIYIYYSYFKSKTNFWSYFQKVVFFLVSSGLTYYLFEIFLDKIASDNLIIFLMISFAINLIIFILLQINNCVKNTIAINFSKVVIGTSLFGYVICIQVVKYFWGRIRFRELDSSFSQFTPWYLPQGITGFDSFPSGHAAMGWMLLALLVFVINKKQWVKYSLFGLIFLWGVMLALSRVVIGAHYASDVLFGSFFIIVTFLLFYKHYNNQS